MYHVKQPSVGPLPGPPHPIMSRPTPAELQQQLWEVDASLRVRVECNASAARVAAAVHRIDLFMRDVHDAADELQLGVELIVQALLAKLAEGTSFDQQAGSGNVPMHQNKVLDRSKRVITMDADRVKDNKWIAKQINENMPKLLEALVLLRENVKIKVEDACDIAMARKWATMAQAFFNTLRQIACGDEDLYAAWRAVQEGTIPDFEASRDAGGEKKEVQLGDLALIQSLTHDFQERINVLASIAGLADDIPLNDAAEALRTGLCAQLKDSRGQVLKAVCEAVCRVANIDAWASMSRDVAAAVISRLNVSNKLLANTLGNALKAIATEHGTDGVVAELAATVSSTSLAPTQVKSAEALVAWVDATGAGRECDRRVADAAQACTTSRHPAARTVGRTLLAACARAWPQDVSAPTETSPERRPAAERKPPARFNRFRAAAAARPSLQGDDTVVVVQASAKRTSVTATTTSTTATASASDATIAPTCDACVPAGQESFLECRSKPAAKERADVGDQVPARIERAVRERTRSLPRDDSAATHSPPCKRSKLSAAREAHEAAGAPSADAAAPMAELPTNVQLPRRSSDPVKASPNHTRNPAAASPVPLAKDV